MGWMEWMGWMGFYDFECPNEEGIYEDEDEDKDKDGDGDGGMDGWILIVRIYAMMGCSEEGIWRYDRCGREGYR